MCSCFNYPSANNRTTKTPPPLRGYSRLDQNMACMRFIMERGRPALCWWTWASRPHSFFHSAMLGSTQSLITLLAAYVYNGVRATRPQLVDVGDPPSVGGRGRVALCWVDVGESPTLLFIYALACWVQFRMCSFLFCSSRLRIQSCRFARNSLFSSI